MSERNIRQELELQADCYIGWWQEVLEDWANEDDSQNTDCQLQAETARAMIQVVKNHFDEVLDLATKAVNNWGK